VQPLLSSHDVLTAMQQCHELPAVVPVGLVLDERVRLQHGSRPRTDLARWPAWPATSARWVVI
jgi:hypothetical protein